MVLGFLERKNVATGGYVTKEDVEDNKDAAQLAKQRAKQIEEEARKKQKEEEEAIYAEEYKKAKAEQLRTKAKEKARYDALPRVVKIKQGLQTAGKVAAEISAASRELTGGSQPVKYPRVNYNKIFDPSFVSGKPSGKSQSGFSNMFNPNIVLGKSPQGTTGSQRRTREQVIEDFNSRIAEIRNHPHAYKAMIISEIAKSRLLNGVDKLTLIRLAEKEGRQRKGSRSSASQQRSVHKASDPFSDVFEQNNRYLKGMWG